MLNRTSLAGFLGGVILATTYSTFVGGCGTALGTIPLLLAWNIVAKSFGGMFAWSFSLFPELFNCPCNSLVPEQSSACPFRDVGTAHLIWLLTILCVAVARVPMKCILFTA